MPHFSEMNFLFLGTKENTSTSTTATDKIRNTAGDSQYSIFSNDEDKLNNYYVYKGSWGNNPRARGYNQQTQLPNEIDSGNKSNFENIKNHTYKTVYDTGNDNPYVDLIKKFDGVNSSKSLIIRPSDLAYLKELGVYPINRMVVLRRFETGQMVPEKLDELNSEPKSTIVGWLKDEENFGEIGFNESWTTTDRPLHELIKDLINRSFNSAGHLKSIVPVPDFAQGLVFQLLKGLGLTGGADSPWDWHKIPIGDPDVLSEGPYRDPAQQNIISQFNFNFKTTYEQKFIGDVDPGSAMIDIIDNLLKMGTSDMKYWLNGDAGIIQKAKGKSGEIHETFYWWNLVKHTLIDFAAAVMSLIRNTASVVGEAFSGNFSASATANKGKNLLIGALNSIMISTTARYRWELRGSLELMTGTETSTPWYLTIGNPYSPWLATNHVIVRKIDIKTSNEVGFNDMPLWLEATITIDQSRNLGRNEIIRMFNNSFLREYSKPNKQTNPNEVDNAFENNNQVNQNQKS